MQKRLVVGLVALLCLVWGGSGCQQHAARSNARASLTISIVTAPLSKTILPAFDMFPASFTVAGVGSTGQTVEISTTQEAVLVEDLDLGDWTFTVSALNAAGALIGQGSAVIQLTDETVKSLTIPVDALTGTGALQLAVQWPAASLLAPSIEASLLPVLGASVSLDFVISGTTATCTKSGLPSGYYTLRIQILDGVSVAAGAVDIVRIVRDQSTVGAIDFMDIPIMLGTVDIDIVPRLDLPLVVQIDGGQSEMGLGRNLVLESWLSEALASPVSTWYVDGQSLASGPAVSLGSDLDLGWHRCDLTVFSADYRRAGSASFRLCVVDPFPLGSLGLSAVIADGAAGVDGLGGCRSICVSPDGTSVYGVGYADSSIAAFQRDSDTGALRFLGQYKNGVAGIVGLSGAESLAVTPDGTHLYAAGYTDGAIAAFGRNLGTGALSFLGCVKDGDAGLGSLAGAKGLSISPDGRNLYCAAYTDNSVLGFSIDPSTAALSLIQTLSDGVGDFTLLGGASSVVVSPDGTQLFVASYTDDSLVVLRRDPLTGLLSASQSFVDGQVGCDGLNGASGVEASLDGTSVYVAGYYDNSVAAFSRDSVTGSLTFQGFFKDGVDGVDGLYYARGVAVSADGASVYAVGSADDAVVFFQRDTATGALTYRAVDSGLDGARGVAVSRDGLNCYVAASGANSLAVFNRARE